MPATCWLQEPWNVARGPVLVLQSSGSPACQNKVSAAPQLPGIIALGLMKIRNQCIRSRKIHISCDNKLFLVLLEYECERDFFHYSSFATIKFFSLNNFKVMAISARITKGFSGIWYLKKLCLISCSYSQSSCWWQKEQKSSAFAMVELLCTILSTAPSPISLAASWK